MYADRLFNVLERREPEPGMLLLGAPGVSRSAILIVAYDGPRIIGVDLTVRSEAAVFNVMPEWHDLAFKPQSFFIGGPLMEQAVTALVVLKDSAPEGIVEFAPLMGRLISGVDPSDLDGAIEGVRFFAGYHLWLKDELDAEIQDGEWYVTPALGHDIASSGDVYAEAMRRQDMPLPLYATFPEQPRDN